MEGEVGEGEKSLGGWTERWMVGTASEVELVLGGGIEIFLMTTKSVMSGDVMLGFFESVNKQSITKSR